MDKMIKKSGQAVGILRCGVGTHATVKAHAKAWPNGMLVKPRVHHDEATVHSMKNDVFWFCFVIPLLRGLFYWTNEDFISV